MCLAVPMQIVEVNGDRAVAEVSGVRREISVALLERAKPGDWVLIHAGFAISRVNRREAAKTLALFRELGTVD